MNEGLKFLYNQVLAKKKSFTTSLCGSYDLTGYMDMHHIYLNWDKFDDASCLTVRQDRFAISMKNGKYIFEDYKL